MLTAITVNVKAKITLVFFLATLLKKVVIADFFSFFQFIFFLLTIFNTAGSKVKVIVMETKRPKVIIQPKSIMGFMPLNIKERKAQIVVNTV